MALHAPGLTDDIIHGLLEMEAESQELDPSELDLRVTTEIEEQVDAYESALDKALIELVRRYPPENGASADDLQNADAAYLVLMTLRGEGVGIWDGDWDDFYDNSRLERGGDVWKFLHARLKSFADDTGAGSLNTAIMDAVGEQGHPEEYGKAMSRHTLGSRMLEWHGGQDDPVYAVGSFYIDSQRYPDPAVARDALANLEAELDETERMRGGERVMVRRHGKQVDLRKFAGYTDRDLEERAIDLSEIVDALRVQMVEDYGGLTENSRYRLQRIKTCAGCGHHVSAHRYSAGSQHAGPGKCTIPSCTCRAFRRPAPGERIRRQRPNRTRR